MSIPIRRRPPKVTVQGRPICQACYKVHGVEAPFVWAVRRGQEWEYWCDSHVGDVVRHWTAPGPWNEFRGAGKTTVPVVVGREPESPLLVAELDLWISERNAEIVRVAVRDRVVPSVPISWHRQRNCPRLKRRRTLSETMTVTATPFDVWVDGLSIGQLCSWCSGLDADGRLLRVWE